MLSIDWKGNTPWARRLISFWRTTRSRFQDIGCSRGLLWCQAACASEAIVRRHYLKVVEENEANQFWGIKPASQNCSVSGSFFTGQEGGMRVARQVPPSIFNALTQLAVPPAGKLRRN